MRPLAKPFALLAIALFIASVLAYGLMILWLRWIGPYDRFYWYELAVSSPKSTYAIDENIELVFEIRSKNRGHVRLFKNRSKSLHLLVRGAQRNAADHESSSFFQHHEPLTGGNETEIIEFDADNPFRMIVRGHIIKDKESGGIIFDFGEFGHFKSREVGRYLIGGYWKPIHPEPFDSLEDYTNSIVVDIESPQEKWEESNSLN